MLHAMKTAASGMMAQQLYIDTIANNLANVNTTAFKKNRMEFQDLIYQSIRDAGIQVQNNARVPVPLQLGHGTRTVASPKIYRQGDMTETRNPLDLMIEGNGFFQILKPDGGYAYTRDGAFKLSADGMIVTSDGFPLDPSIILPEDTTEVSISAEGTVTVKTVGDNESIEIGDIYLSKFVNPAGLQSIGKNLLVETEASGQAMLYSPGTEGVGLLSQGFLENSNVEVVEEMVNMILAQRAYEISSKAIQTSDEMVQLVNNLRR
jgi:flagellar basal-body rod protein FlgG